MGLIDKVLDRYFQSKGLNPNTATGIIPVNAITIRDYKGDYTEAYRSSVELFSVLRLLNKKAASIPWYVYKKKEGNRAKIALERYKHLSKSSQSLERALVERSKAYDDTVIVEGTSLSKLLTQPNPNQGQDEFFESVFGFYNLTGEANIWGNSGEADNITGEFYELQVLPTKYVEDAYDPNDLYGILGYQLNVGNRINIAKENLARWKNWHPDFDPTLRTHMRGISVVEVGWRNYLMGLNGSTAAANMLKNGGAKGALSPAVVGGTVHTMTPEQLSSALGMINSRFNGNENAGNIGILGKPYDYLQFGLTAVDMDIINIMNLTLHQWCRITGVPTVLFDSEHTSDNNYQNGMRDLVTNTLVPMMGSVRDKLNKWLLPRFKAQGMFIDFDVSALPELQRDMEKLVNQLKQAYWLTEDEKRIGMGYEPKGGIYDSSLVPTGLTPIENIGMDISTEPDVPY